VTAFPLEKARLGQSKIFRTIKQSDRGLPCGVEHQESLVRANLWLERVWHFDPLNNKSKK